MGDIQQAIAVRQKVDALRTEVNELFSSLLPAFDGLNERFKKLQDDVRGHLEPQLLREKLELEEKLAAAKRELGQCVSDLRYINSTHPQDYALRRASEVEKKLSEL